MKEIIRCTENLLISDKIIYLGSSVASEAISRFYLGEYNITETGDAGSSPQ